MPAVRGVVADFDDEELRVKPAGRGVCHVQAEGERKREREKRTERERQRRERRKPRSGGGRLPLRPRSAAATMLRGVSRNSWRTWCIPPTAAIGRKSPADPPHSPVDRPSVAETGSALTSGIHRGITTSTDSTAGWGVRRCPRNRSRTETHTHTQETQRLWQRLELGHCNTRRTFYVVEKTK